MDSRGDLNKEMNAWDAASDEVGGMFINTGITGNSSTPKPDNKGGSMELKVDGVTEINGQGWRECSDTHNKIYYQGIVCPLCEANFMLRINKDEIRFELNHFYNELLKKEMI